VHGLGLASRHLYLLDVVRERLDYPGLKRRVKAEQARRPADVVLIEDRASGTQPIQELVDEGLHAATACRPQADKVMRIWAQTAMIENGFVHLPEAAPWLAQYLGEFASFPYGRFDDQVPPGTSSRGRRRRCSPGRHLRALPPARRRGQSPAARLRRRKSGHHAMDPRDPVLQLWFGGPRDIELQGDVIGLGRYGKTLTGLHGIDPPDDAEDEDDALIEAWTRRAPPVIRYQ
jgi:predicted phage terminase large subunit-like protein